MSLSKAKGSVVPWWASSERQGMASPDQPRGTERAGWLSSKRRVGVLVAVTAGSLCGPVRAAEVPFGPQQILSASDVNRPASVFAADVDGDGDIDVLIASQGDNKIAWYENTDGKGTFGDQQVISTAADRPQSVFASTASSSAMYPATLAVRMSRRKLVSS